MSTVTIVLQEAPYGNEKTWNALRLSQELLSAGSRVRIFLRGVGVRSCITCTKTRGLTREDFIDGAQIGKTIDLARWVEEGGPVMVF